MHRRLSAGHPVPHRHDDQGHDGERQRSGRELAVVLGHAPTGPTTASHGHILRPHAGTRKSRYNLRPAMSGPFVESGRGLVFRARLESGRRIAGAALALVGIAIAVQLVRAIATNRASTHAHWGAYLPVVLVFGAVALAFLLPGALMMFYCREVRVDPENRQIVERQTYLGFGRTRAYALADFTQIVLARRLITRRRSGTSVGNSHARRSSPFFVVELTPAVGKPVSVVTDQREDPARDAAVTLAALTHLAIDDEVERERAREAAGVGEDDEA